MTVETLLSRLDHVKQTGAGRWLARCPAHDDKSPSLSIRETDDGRILVHCFTGCDVNSIVQAVGLTLGDLFPDRPIDHSVPRERRPFPAEDVLRAVSFETTVVSLLASKILRNEVFSDDDYARLRLAADRLDRAVLIAGGGNG